MSDRLQLLKTLLTEGASSTQDELREMLLKKGHDVNQSTISRDLKRVGAIKAVDSLGRTVYKLSADTVPTSVQSNSLKDMVTSIRSNGQLIVLNTNPGSASLVARHLDLTRPAGILGTIAGDDTIFVAPADVKHIQKTLIAIEESFG